MSERDPRVEQLHFPDAREFAINAHGEQKYGDMPYVVHLRAVVNVLKRFHKATPELEAAAWLHDALEDTDAKPEDIEKLFGREVRELVWAVTDEPAGANRKERAMKTYPKIRAVGIKAVTLKLADRIANVEHSINFGTRHLPMYRKEFAAFRKGLFRPGESIPMWHHLGNLIGGERAE